MAALSLLFPLSTHALCKSLEQWVGRFLNSWGLGKWSCHLPLDSDLWTYEWERNQLLLKASLIWRTLSLLNFLQDNMPSDFFPCFCSFINYSPTASARIIPGWLMLLLWSKHSRGFPCYSHHGLIKALTRPVCTSMFCSPCSSALISSHSSPHLFYSRHNGHSLTHKHTAAEGLCTLFLIPCYLVVHSFSVSSRLYSDITLSIRIFLTTWSKHLPQAPGHFPEKLGFSASLENATALTILGPIFTGKQWTWERNSFKVGLWRTSVILPV